MNYSGNDFAQSSTVLSLPRPTSMNNLKNVSELKSQTEGKNKEDKITKIMKYLISENYDKQINRKMFQGLTKMEFLTIFEFLMRKVVCEENLKIDSDEQILAILQDINYPNKFNRSSLVTVAARK